MALTSLSVRNYQSLHHVDIDVAPFTVIVGPSSSGKSALTRALRLLLANARGSSFISTWAPRTIVSADFQAGTLTLMRNRKDSSLDAYTIAAPPGPDEDAPPSTWTKLGGAVPEEVTAFTGITDVDLHFASQFDKPYLLDDSAATVARALAALTNVEVVFEAARNANRQRLAGQATTRTRTADLDSTRAARQGFQNLPGRLAALDRAEHRLAQAQALGQRITAMAALVETVTAAQATVTRTQHLATRTVPDIAPVGQAATDLAYLSVHAARLVHAQEILSRGQPRPVPSLTEVVAAAHEHQEFQKSVARLRSTSSALATAKSVAEDTARALDAAHDAYTEFLSSLGTCPTCGQPVDIAHIEMEKIHA